MRKFRYLSHWLWAIVSLALVIPLVPLLLSQAQSLPAAYLPLVLKNFPPISTRPPTPVTGRVLFSEIMLDPVGVEPDPEWFELYNDGGAALNLSGYKIGDEESPGGSEGMMQFPEGTSIQPGQVIVIAHQAALFQVAYGFIPGFEIDETDPLVPNLFKCSSGCRTSIELTNSGDELLLLDAAGDVADASAWGSSAWNEFQPPVRPVPPEGNTLERYPAYQDSDSATDWRGQPKPNPGQANVTPPTPTPGPEPTPMPFNGQILISELLADPSGSEPGGEWIEIYNPDDTTHSLAGFKIGDEETPPGSEGMMAFPVGAQINAGQVIVIANRAADFLVVYGFKPQYEINTSDESVPDLIKYSAWGTGSLNLTNAGDEVLLLDPADHLVDGVAYGDSAYLDFQPPVSLAPEGSSLERYPLIPDTDTATDWRIQASPAPGQVDLSTPPTPTPLPLLAINEIHADPHLDEGDANHDGVVNTSDDEFVEFVNTTNAPINLGGWTIHDSTSLRHTFPISSVVPANCSLVIFGGGTISGTFGGGAVMLASSGALGLNNSGDTITLFNASTSPVISYTYGSEAGEDQALTRSPDITGLFARHTLVAAASGRRFSPGTRLDGMPFAGCSGAVTAQPPLSGWVQRNLWGGLALLFVPLARKWHKRTTV